MSDLIDGPPAEWFGTEEYWNWASQEPTMEELKELCGDEPYPSNREW